jgi:hypothetical protein
MRVFPEWAQHAVSARRLAMFCFTGLNSLTYGALSPGSLLVGVLFRIEAPNEDSRKALEKLHQHATILRPSL